MFVPTTTNSILAKQIRHTLHGTGPIGTVVKVVERPRPTIVTGLARNSPFPRLVCGRDKCPL